ncbi:hypothetical protein [Anaerocolumna sp. MB42-C2]|uniref:hypothetical protein n=1 Tax=Anaerocolumna sp. MB42-C2 TaxID=3070997 RepID=UPI0027DF44C3|nr:hypothetical protein [Anaerocolumna sp. MB42-C2]WMJ86324.1 hypothetical protein RBU59_20090 [Anaerocolumna sp. MB42-C2]
MGIIKKLFKNKNKKKESPVKQDINLESDDFNNTLEDEIIKSTEKSENKNNEFDPNMDSGNFITDNCDQILESSKQLEELKVEYQAVTSYLTDIQKLEQIPSEEREYLNDTARKIITFTRERAKYQNKTRKITDAQYKHIARYEDILPQELKKMKNNEAYNNTIKTDMKYLEGEKGALLYQKEEILNRHTYLKNIAVVTCILVFSLFLLFVILQNVTKANMQIPFLMTITMALVSAVYIFINSGVNRNDMKLTERKLNKAINLLNKVKIKYINNTNELDYSYQKYMVNSYAELWFLWEQYLKAKEEEKIYEKNTKQLEFYNRELVKELRSYDLKDPDIWVYQAAAVIDSKEMVEVRHRLNVRRQKLRDRIEYNNKLKEKSIEDITWFVNQRPANREEVTRKLKDYGIYL